MRKIQKLKVDLSQIPCPFNMYEHGERVETGPVQFNDDWPGVFIRGDNALWIALQLDQYIKCVEKGEKPNWPEELEVKGLLRLLQGSYISNSIEENDDDSDVGC